jgi:hypothetical protein
MIIFKDTFATVWNVETKGNAVRGRISTSEKDNRNEGKYINSNWFVTFVGKAKEKATALSPRDKIKILSGKVTNIVVGDGDNKKSFLNVVIFDFEDTNNRSNSNTNGFNSSIDDDMPF